ncbi:hypothetical protein, partial [Phascolarctobacterium succinatutens]
MRFFVISIMSFLFSLFLFYNFFFLSLFLLAVIKEAGTKSLSQTKEGLEFEFFSNSSPFTLRKIKLQLYAAHIF